MVCAKITSLSVWRPIQRQGWRRQADFDIAPQQQCDHLSLPTLFTQLFTHIYHVKCNGALHLHLGVSSDILCRAGSGHGEARGATGR